MADENSSQPKKWWQWLLVYPVVLTSIIAAIPTYIETMRALELNVPYGQSSQAKFEDNMWRKNLACTSAPVDPLVTVHNIQVDATICESGDVLVKVFSPDGEKYYQWVAVQSLLDSKHTSFGIIGTAFANSNPEYMVIAENSQTICQKYISQGRVLRRISVAGGGCFDEIINTYNGKVIKTTPAACSKKC